MIAQCPICGSDCYTPTEVFVCRSCGASFLLDDDKVKIFDAELISEITSQVNSKTATQAEIERNQIYSSALSTTLVNIYTAAKKGKTTANSVLLTMQSQYNDSVALHTFLINELTKALTRLGFEVIPEIYGNYLEISWKTKEE